MIFDDFFMKKVSKNSDFFEELCLEKTLFPE